MTVAELVKQRLRELGWSNAELARRSGLSGTYIGQIVNDRVPGTPAGRKVHWTEPTLRKAESSLDRADVEKTGRGIKPATGIPA